MDTTKDMTRNRLLQAALAKYTAKKAEALAHLEVIFTSPVGIGEHTDLLKEVTMWTEQFANAEEAMAVLKHTFTTDGKVA